MIVENELFQCKPCVSCMWETNPDAGGPVLLLCEPEAGVSPTMEHDWKAMYLLLLSVSEN